MQIIKFSWSEFSPKFILDNGKELPLFDQMLAFRTGRKTCIGYYKNGTRYPCPENRFVLYENSCHQCMSKDSYANCIKCDGSLCINEKQREQCRKSRYVVYLAAFNSILKIGISLRFRMMQRFVEQGADTTAKLLEMRDGKEARKMEKQISNFLGVTDRVKGKIKKQHIFSDEKPLENINKTLELMKISPYWYKLSPEFYDLRNYYRLANVTEEPSALKVTTGSKIEGRVAAVKGNIIILKNNNGFFSVNARRLVGREIESL